jgi:hypothetical protein
MPAVISSNFVKPGAEPFDALAGIEEDVDSALELVQDLLGVDERVLRAGLSELEYGLLGACKDLFGSPGR